MSGGSHDYFYRRMADGDFVDTHHIDGLVDSLSSYVSGRYSDGELREHETHDGGWRRFNDEERARLETHGAVALAALASLKETCELARRQASALADIAHSVEWADSGDSCADSVLESLTKFAETPKP